MKDAVAAADLMTADALATNTISMDAVVTAAMMVDRVVTDAIASDVETARFVMDRQGPATDGDTA